MASTISELVWREKYRFTGRDGQPEHSVEDTLARVARAAASVEQPRQRKVWERRFLDALDGFRFIPAGRILAGAGTDRDVTLFNCFVMGRIDDDMASIFAHVREAALTLQRGGGIGHDFSTLRPRGAPVKGVGADASGPVSFMDVWDAMCKTIMSAGSRRGAMMGTLRCDHPDIEAFVEAKADAARLRNFNVSVLITDAFMEAVKRDAEWPLVFGGLTYRTVEARGLWQKIMRAAYDYAEPGVIFVDRINAANPINYCETIHATNPCGEQPLPPYGACLLGSINLAALVEQPFTPEARIREDTLRDLVAVAVRFLDNVIDLSNYPLEAQREEARSKRRLGLGVTGLADALIFSGLHYGSQEARETAAGWLKAITSAAYEASADLAGEKGTFPLYNAEAHLAQPFVSRLPAETRSAIRKKGLRNGLLTSIAPTGTISLLGGNVSSGIEPVFDLKYERRMLMPDGRRETIEVEDYAVRIFREKHGDAALPAAFVTAMELAPRDHLLMQAALQPHVDAAISKTVNCPKEMPFEAFQSLYLEAFDLGLKGCTAYRPNDVTGAVLVPSSKPVDAPAAPLPAVAQPALPLKAPPPLDVSSPLASRDPVLAGFTYKLVWPPSDHALYITINDSIEGGVRRPFEIFMNSKNLEHYAWTVALTRMISAVFRRGGDVSFVVEELKAIFDPRGGAWIEGRYVPSLLAAIGGVIDGHLRHIGFYDALSDGAGTSASIVSNSAKTCPRCSMPELVHQEGCMLCRNCGFSTCG
jgi:ribonucleoside-diphosphate reductase alpha chain